MLKKESHYQEAQPYWFKRTIITIIILQRMRHWYRTGADECPIFHHQCSIFRRWLRLSYDNLSDLLLSTQTIRTKWCKRNDLKIFSTTIPYPVLALAHDGTQGSRAHPDEASAVGTDESKIEVKARRILYCVRR